MGTFMHLLGPEQNQETDFKNPKLVFIQHIIIIIRLAVHKMPFHLCCSPTFVKGLHPKLRARVGCLSSHCHLCYSEK